ncbi:MerR family transcriptional regulator [Streptomyces sp. NPDC051561]|uniref:MerR family transcriptional regulator n=1 Tax=Streptomyces sp. NPDC051561 TaxID=3365658 RepID=UPI0037BA9F1E
MRGWVLARGIPGNARIAGFGTLEGERAVRIGELSRRTGVPVPTIKYYVREGLLPSGELTSPNQASYDDAHERRLRLIRALLGAGGLPLARIAKVLEAVDDTSQPAHKLLGTVAGSVAAPLVPPTGGSEEPSERARQRVAELAERRGWLVPPGNPDGDALALTLSEAERLGHEEFAGTLDAYAEAAEKVAGADLAYVTGRGAFEDVLESVVVGMVLGDAMFGSLRRIAQAEESRRVLGGGGE